MFKISNMKKLLLLLSILLFPSISFAAIAATHIETSANNTSATSYTTSSHTPTTNDLEMLTVGNQVSSGTVNIPTVTGDGLTWVQVATQISSDNLRRVTLFRAMGTPTTGVLTIDMAAQTQVRSGWSWSEFSGTDKSGTNGSGAIVQSGTTSWNTGDGVKTSILVTLSAFGNINDIPYGGIRFGTNASSNLTVGSGFTELGTALSFIRYESEYGSANDNTVDWSYPSESTFTEAVAAEIKIAPTTVSGDMMRLAMGF